MDVLYETLFATPLYLYATLVVAELIMLAVWYGDLRRRSRLIALAVPIVLAVGVFAAEAMVQTDREEIAAALESVEAGFDTDGRTGIETAVNLLADPARIDFADNKGPRELTGDEALAGALAVVNETRIEGVNLTAVRTEVNGPRATTTFRSFIKSDLSTGSGTFVVDWRIHWVRTDGGWRIEQVDRPELPESLYAPGQ